MPSTDNLLKRFLKDFFLAVESPVNIAVFRIVLFGMLLNGLSMNSAVFWSSLPKDLLFPPTGVAPLMRFIPLNPAFAVAMHFLFALFCFFAFIGYRARLSAAVVAVTGIYLMGLANLYGKINHAHHQIWFAALLSVSRCADALSVDAVIKAFGRAKVGDTRPPAPDAAYALPLRFIWLLFGIIYFSPGFWKLQSAGLAWALSDNPKIMLYNKWAELGGWRPLFRIDQYPFLYKLGALGTIAFEISFFFLILFRRTRFFAVIWGLFFHASVFFTMQIRFWRLLICYVVFVDWAGLFRWLGARMFPADMRVLFDGNCGICRKTIGSLRAFDVFDRVLWVNALDEPALIGAGAGGLSREDLLHDMHVLRGPEVLTGFDGYRALARRVPLLWPLVPFLRLPPVVFLGESIYRRVADHRLCALSVRGAADAHARPAPLWPVWTVGLFLLVATALAGATNLNSWPIARYPTFAGMFKPEISFLSMVVTTTAGETVDVSALTENTEIPASRMMGMLKRLLAVKEEQERSRRLRAFWQVFSKAAGIKNAATVRVYRETVDTTPGAGPGVRELIYEFKPEAF